MSLARRFSLLFILVLVPFGGFALWVAERGARAHLLEFTQRQNAPIAMYMAQRRDLLRGGELDRDALATLAEQVMTINPSVEVYVLDRAGHVIAQASTANQIARPRVSLEPIHAFLAADLQRPVHGALLGDDPLDPGTHRPFSVHPLNDHDGERIGYVYAVLGGRRHASLLASLRTSHSLRGVVWTLGGALAFALGAGTLVSFMLTRRLGKITTRARHWEAKWETDHAADLAKNRSTIRCIAADRATDGAPSGTVGDWRGDEIDALACAWETMSMRLREQYRARVHAEREHRELIAGVSHDLRTPLTTLQGYLETALMCRGNMTAADELRCLETAFRQSQRLERLIVDLFELSRLDAGDRVLECERFSIAELAQDALQDLETRAQAIGATLALRIGEHHVPEVLADIALVQRVFDNLLDNALRHLRPGGRASIEIDTCRNGRVRLAVVDDGVGMTAETLARATAAGFRATASGGLDRADDDRHHAGLGLAIVRGIVTLHGGTLEIASRPGHGSEFAFTLAAARPTGQDDSTRHVPNARFA